MLYVFHVDVGRMIKFDMNVALSSVQNLKDMIERLHGFPATNIVLLVSGGEMLIPGSLVCSYSAGTDTNPIYMFCTVDIKQQPWPSIEPDVDLKEQVDRCLSLPATYSTVVTRATLAQQIYDLAREEESICERLVHEQHLQQQGWSAVIANMEDLIDEFRQRYGNFNRYFHEHLRKRNVYLELLGQFNKDLEKLSRIPILPGLMQNAEEEFHGFDDYLDNDEVFSRSQQNSSMIQQQQELTNSQQQSQKLPSPRENTPESGISSTEPQKVRTLTLLQWISAKENHSTLRVMAQECLQGLVTFDDDKFDKINFDVSNVIKFAEQEDIKEIKGLEDRLCGLERLMFQLKKLVQDQKELSTAFQQNQNRASNLGDASILPDLCASHRSQLLVMLSSHRAIRDIRRRISKAKDELGDNLDKRLKYIVNIENSMSELDSNLLFYHRCLQRVERHLNIIQQIHQTPSIYVSAVTEVIRRRIFSGEFVQWASNLACDFYTIHNEEVMRRQEFNASFEGHFLNTLFPGINDIPPTFANETPIIFDSNLPNLTKNDIEILSSYLPELTSTIQLPDMGSVIEFFVSRSGNKSADDKSSLTGKSQSNTAVGSIGAVPHRPIDIHAHLKDGFESETDTEEFEKVGQSANERNIPLSTATIATSTSENIRQTNSAGTSTDPLETHTVETLTESCAPKKPPRTTKILNTTRHTEAPLPAIPEKPDNRIITNSNTQKIAQPFSPDIPKSLTSPHSLLYKQKSNHQHQDYYYHNYYETVGHQPLSLSGEQTSIISITTTSRPGPNQSPTSPYPINNILIDNEFVNSEFYIDESLPSSLNDDDDNFKDNCIDERERVIRSYFHKTRDYGGQRSSSSDESIGAVQSIDKSNFNKRSLETVFGLLQENLGSTRLEVERLKSLLNSMSQISYQCLDTLKKHLKSIKSDAESAKQELQTDITKLTESLKEIKNNCEAREKETLKRLSMEHQQILDNIQKDLNSKQSEINVLIDEKSTLANAHSQAISNLKEERDSLNEQIQKLSQQIECLQDDIKRSDVEKEKAVIECRDRLIHEHKTEIESLRCRFKLMTSMERSPSDTSLEKIEKPDVIDIACHELILNQTREDLKIQKELAIIAAVEEERSKWISQNHPTSSDIDLLKNIIDEKTKQLDAMRERDLILFKENCQLKIKIESLTTEEESDKVWLKEKIDFLNKDKNRLEQELNMEKSRRMEMETSFATIKSSTIVRDQGSAPELSGGRCKMTSSQSLTKQGAIIESCVKGDIVFVVWNVKHGQYTIVQDSSSLYFVHGDSLPPLNLRLPGNGETDIPVPFYCLGRIVDKEYCQARKDENRYKVTKGTRFYRVKLQPLSKSETARAHHNKRERYESSSSSTSVSRSTSTQHLIDSFAQTENPVVHSSSRDMVDSASLKERTTSVTSVVEEDDEPISLLSERCRYISLSEEDEKANIDSSSSNTDCAITTNISTSTTSITTTTTTPSTNQQIPTESSSEKEQDDSDEYRSLEAKDETYFP